MRPTSRNSSTEFFPMAKSRFSRSSACGSIRSSRDSAKRKSCFGSREPRKDEKKDAMVAVAVFGWGIADACFGERGGRLVELQTQLQPTVDEPSLSWCLG